MPRNRVAIACQGGGSHTAINRAIASGGLQDPRFRPMRVSRISLDRDLNYRSKLDRRSALLEELRELGRTKVRWFLRERASQNQLPVSAPQPPPPA